MAEASASYPVTEVERYRYAAGAGHYFAERIGWRMSMLSR